MGLEGNCPAPKHILINGLSIGSGGGYTVGRELLRHLALERPGATFTISLIGGNRLHGQMSSEDLPGNCRIHWVPAKATGRPGRAWYERTALAGWARSNAVSAVLQLNGMVIPGLGLPSFVHFQDPWPYRPEAWSGWRDRLMAGVKRRANREALRNAGATGWTSAYLRDLVCGRLNIRPRRSEVYYNGVPADWIERARRGVSPWEDRPLQLVSVSNVARYKRQELVIRAVPLLAKKPGFQSLVYRIVGECAEAYRRELSRLAESLGVGNRVVFEGRVSDERVRQLLETSRCFVLMSVCESFGIPAIEAMSFGTPVVVSNCCAMPEVCGDAADLCPVDDVEALAGALARALTDPAHAGELRVKGVERVERFNWAATGARMARTLDELTAS